MQFFFSLIFITALVLFLNFGLAAHVKQTATTQRTTNTHNHHKSATGKPTATVSSTKQHAHLPHTTTLAPKTLKNQTGSKAVNGTAERPKILSSSTLFMFPSAPCPNGQNRDPSSKCRETFK